MDLPRWHTPFLGLDYHVSTFREVRATSIKIIKRQRLHLSILFIIYKMRISSFSCKPLSLVTLIAPLLCFLVHQSFAAVLAIDYGTEWTKAALVKPGIPLQIVLTKDTKRKEQSVVAFKKQERLYGADGFNLVPFTQKGNTDLDDRERDFQSLHTRY
jgi:hypothetical protein